MLQAGISENSDRVADKVRALAEVVLAEGSASTSEGPDAALQRSAAEIFAFSACIGSDGFALQLVRAVCAAAAETTSLGRYAHAELHCFWSLIQQQGLLSFTAGGHVCKLRLLSCQLGVQRSCLG